MLIGQIINLLLYIIDTLFFKKKKFYLNSFAKKRFKIQFKTQFKTPIFPQK